MSALHMLPPGIKQAIKELRAVQKARLKAKMGSTVDIGNGTVILQDSYTVEKPNGVKKKILPCSDILCYSISKTIVTLQLREHFYVDKCILELRTIEQVGKILSSIKPSANPRPDTYQNDGNVTSSDTDSSDSALGKTSGVNNSFDSDNPSEHD